MLRIPSIAATLSVVFLLLGGAQARCDFIPWRIDAGFGSLDFNWWITGIPNAAGNTAGLGLDPLFGPNQSGSVRIGLVRVDAGESSMLDNPPLSDAATAGDYVMSLFLTDKASQKSAILTFGGHISLQIGPESPGAFVANRFLGPTTQSARLGSNFYTVNLDPFTFASSNVIQSLERGVWVAPNLGTIDAFVDVHPAGANNAPEPCCLALAGMGLGCLAVGFTVRRRWRRPAVAVG